MDQIREGSPPEAPASVRITGRLPMFAFFAVSCVVYLVAIWARKGTELADDGAFFARYAENMAHGRFWVWNAGEPPIWGSSAPLYPLLPALLIKLGVAPVAALVRSGIVMGTVGLSIAGTALARRFGLIAGVVFVFLSALDTDSTYYVSSGLETPLTFLLLGLALWVLLERPQGDIRGRAAAWPLGVVAGLLLVHKLDLVPVGILLLLSVWTRDRRFPTRAAVTAGSMALAWYGFAWIYFGAPVPNSFLTKALHQSENPSSLDWTWFGETVLSRPHMWALGLAPIALLFVRRATLPALIFLGGTAALHLIAYSNQYPFEPYDWYTLPSVFALIGMAAIGTQMFSNWVWARRGSYGRYLSVASTIVLMAVVLRSNLKDEQEHTRSIKLFLAYEEADRTDAGRWVDANTPKNFRVLTAWGNPAFYSHRYVVDASFLNRKYDDGLPTGSERPEVLVWQNNPGSTPEMMVFSNHIDVGYTAVRVFKQTYLAGADYFFVVLVRDDVLSLMPAEALTESGLSPVPQTNRDGSAQSGPNA